MSNLEEAYRSVGADWDGVTKRLMGEELVYRFAGKFLEDDSFAKLKQALADRDVEAAFMAAHTLKGICQNLGFDNLYKPSAALTEILRAGTLEGADEAFAPVEAEYNKTVAAIKPCV